MKINKLHYLVSIGIIVTACSVSKNKAETALEVVEQTVETESAELISYKSVNSAYMDQAVRPQDDFFSYANGTWVKNNPVPPSESRWGSFNELEKSNNEKLTAILTNAMTNPGEKGSQNQLLGDYYKSFISMDVRNKQGLSSIQQELDRITNLKSRTEIVNIMAESHILGIGMGFGFGVGQDMMDVDNHITYMGQGGIGLPNCTYYTAPEKAEILVAYEKHITAVFELMNIETAKATAMAKSIVAFETELAKGMMTPAERRIPEKTYNKMAKTNVDSMFGQFDFEAYLSKLGSQSFDSIVVGQPLYLETFKNVYENGKMEDWKNYLLWSTINHYAGSLDSKFVELNFAFYGGVLSGQTEMTPINERAIEEITNLEIGELLGKAFVDLYFSQQAQDRVNDMVDNLLVVFGERIEALEWMTPETKEQALIKLNSIGRKLGFPEKWEDFSKLNFVANDYIANTKELTRYAHFKNLAELNKPVDKEKWGMPAHMVNAYYHPLMNEIAFPAGIMQPPFFDVMAEDAVNYGSIGMVIGHEFTHGFDDMGSKFDAEGAFRNWWSEEDRKMFEERTGILGETFSNFCPIEDHCVNPELTMGENIADLGGLTMAYYAYTRTEEFKNGELISGFTPAQRFFLAYAQLWKINYTEEEMKNRIANDSHSPGMYRVNGPLKNCPEFFAAFGVKEGDKMRNSEGKVAKIW
jgi:putative endopeptidase